jgi:hypothetical protein
MTKIKEATAKDIQDAIQGTGLVVEIMREPDDESRVYIRIENEEGKVVFYAGWVPEDEIQSYAQFVGVLVRGCAFEQRS